MSALADQLAALTPSERAALRRIEALRMRRRRNGFGPPGKGVSLDMASRLQRKGLVRVDHFGAPQLMLSGAGVQVLAVLDQRASRRRA
jgi:hypothetical protein